MPYIEPGWRQELDNGAAPDIPGDLNYLLTKTIIRYLCSNGQINYTKLNDVMGALEGCKAEFYRRAVVPYEEGKIEANGDVYGELMEAMGLGLETES